MKRIGKEVLIARMVERLPKQLPHYRKQAVLIILNEFLRQLNIAMLNKEYVEIRQFGSFSVARIKNKLVRNPRTGQSIVHKDYYRIHFKGVDKMRDKLNAKNRG